MRQTVILNPNYRGSQLPTFSYDNDRTPVSSPLEREPSSPDLVNTFNQNQLDYSGMSSNLSEPPPSSFPLSGNYPRSPLQQSPIWGERTTHPQSIQPSTNEWRKLDNTIFDSPEGLLGTNRTTNQQVPQTSKRKQPHDEIDPTLADLKSKEKTTNLLSHNLLLITLLFIPMIL